MIDLAQSLWRELLGSWWVLAVLPILVILRWILSSRWASMNRFRRGFFSWSAWDSVLSPPVEESHVESATAKAVVGVTTVSSHSSADAPGSDNAAVVSSSNGKRTNATGALAEMLDAAEYRRRWFLELVESALVALLLVFFIIRPFVVQAFYIPSPSMVETLEVYDRILVNKFIYHLHAPNRGDIVVFQPPRRATEKVEDDWIKRVVGIPGDRISVHANHLFLNGVQQQEPYVALLDRFTDKPGMEHRDTGHYDYIFPDALRPNANAQFLDADSPGLRPAQNAYIYPADEATLLQDNRFKVEATTDTSPRAPRTSGNDYLFFVHNDVKEGLEIVVPPGQLFVMGDNRNDSEDSHFWGCLDQKRVLGQAFCIFWPFSHARFLTNPHSH